MTGRDGTPARPTFTMIGWMSMDFANFSIFFGTAIARAAFVGEGKAEKISREKSARYFHSRPKGSQIGALVSDQSDIIKDRKVIENKLNKISEQYKDENIIPIPENWGGYHIEITNIEFWQGRANRLHDRIHYKLDSEWFWHKNRLSP